MSPLEKKVCEKEASSHLHSHVCIAPLKAQKVGSGADKREEESSRRWVACQEIAPHNSYSAAVSKEVMQKKGGAQRGGEPKANRGLHRLAKKVSWPPPPLSPFGSSLPLRSASSFPPSCPSPSTVASPSPSSPAHIIHSLAFRIHNSYFNGTAQGRERFKKTETRTFFSVCTREAKNPFRLLLHAWISFSLCWRDFDIK